MNSSAKSFYTQPFRPYNQAHSIKSSSNLYLKAIKDQIQQLQSNLAIQNKREPEKSFYASIKEQIHQAEQQRSKNATPSGSVPKKISFIDNKESNKAILKGMLGQQRNHKQELKDKLALLEVEKQRKLQKLKEKYKEDKKIIEDEYKQAMNIQLTQYERNLKKSFTNRNLKVETQHLKFQSASISSSSSDKSLKISYQFANKIQSTKSVNDKHLVSSLKKENSFVKNTSLQRNDNSLQRKQKVRFESDQRFKTENESKLL